MCLLHAPMHIVGVQGLPSVAGDLMPGQALPGTDALQGVVRKHTRPCLRCCSSWQTCMVFMP